MKLYAFKSHQNIYFFRYSFLIVLLLSLTHCSDDTAQELAQTEINVQDEKLDLDLAQTILQEENSDKSYSSRRSSAGSRTLNTINAALRCSGLNSTLFSGDKTIFAPTDAAFAALGLDEDNVCSELDVATLRAILNYHVVDSKIERTQRGCVEMIDGDITLLSTLGRFGVAINNQTVGTIYNQSRSYYDLNVFMVSGVLQPPVGNIVETVESDNQLSFLASAINVFPALKAALSDESSLVTIFAPTDAAMRRFLVKNGSGNIDRLVERLGSEVLAQVLSYHVIDDCVPISNLEEGDDIASIQGGILEYSNFRSGIIDEERQVNRLDEEDILASNGIIHKIQSVMSPELEISNAGLNVRPTTNSVADAKASILNTFANIDAIGVPAQISHSTNAANVGRELNPTELIYFGNPRLGTPIMQANQQAGIDLPQKYLIYEDDEGDTRIAYNDISYIQTRHGISDDVPTLTTMRGALNNFASMQSSRSAGPITGTAERGEGLIDKISNNSLDETYNNLVTVITNNPNLRIILELDHQANAARVGLDLRPTRLIVFGNPNLGTPLMQNQQSVGIDLPQKFLVWEDEGGAVHISYNDPFYLQSRHGIRGNEDILNTISGALNALSNVGGGL
jgi:uncharacterized protein (DUF302 family)/uncharacterized surface protein with fasciclin (FAS1) repeats